MSDLPPHTPNTYTCIITRDRFHTRDSLYSVFNPSTNPECRSLNSLPRSSPQFRENNFLRPPLYETGPPINNSYAVHKSREDNPRLTWKPRFNFHFLFIVSRDRVTLCAANHGTRFIPGFWRFLFSISSPVPLCFPRRAQVDGKDMANIVLFVRLFYAFSGLKRVIWDDKEIVIAFRTLFWNNCIDIRWIKNRRDVMGCLTKHTKNCQKLEKKKNKKFKMHIDDTCVVNFLWKKFSFYLSFSCEKYVYSKFFFSDNSNCFKHNDVPRNNMISKEINKKITKREWVSIHRF